ncbi:protein trachealess-like isoform X3 [Centruroides vittatus]|uniref:protein trachealess-like isoform X3 n=1 Tax=Centruroides vittatus TaxID=120091 RepID=UPI003510AD65
MQPTDGYRPLPMDLHVTPQGYHPYYSILEMRKEKSRDAARSRRGKENYEFYELAKLLPLPAAITSQLDKASIIRLSISYLKLRDFSGHGDPPWSRDGPSSKSIKGAPLRPRSMTAVAMEIFEQHQGTHILQSLDGFAFALAADGRFLYISETVSIYLGLSQVEMTGSSIFDYCHQQDHAELAEQLGINLTQTQPMPSPGSVGSDDGSSSAPGGPSTPTGLERQAPVMTLNNTTPYKGFERSFCIRMKSTLTKRGCHFKSSGYRVVLVLCHLRPQYTFSHSRKQPPNVMGMVGLAIALPPPSVNEVRLENDMFVTRLTFDFRIAHCEPRVSELFDYTAEELTGKNMYTLCHGQDVQKLRKCHIDLINKGQVMSGYYRFMNKNGGFTWVQTCATVIINSKNAEEQSIICVNYVISGIEYENYIMDYSQFSHLSNLKPDDPSDTEHGSSPDKNGRGFIYCYTDDTPTKERETPKSSSPKSNSAPSGESNHSDHLTHLDTGNKHPDPLRPVGETGCGQEDSTGDFDVDPEQLDLTVDTPHYVEEKSSRDIGIHQSHHSRQRKRKLPAECITVDDHKTSPKSQTASVSSLNSSPMSGSDYLPNGERNVVVSPERTLLSHREDTSSPHDQLNRPEIQANSDSDSQKGVARPWKRSPNSLRSSHIETNGASAMSVKELEDAMNKHLPSVGTTNHTNLSQETLSQKSQSHPQQSQRSTIQWIGGSQTTLPASSFLRQLYVNRESVIRSGTHVSRSSYYGEVQGTLPTPPSSGGESYTEQTPQFMIPAKMAAESYGVIPGYSTAPVTMSSYMDTYSAMTPPASVSPREKFHPGISDTTSFTEAAAAAAAAAIPHMHHYVPDTSLQHLPLKPQVFVHPSTIDYSHSHAQQALSSEHQQQLYAHHASSFHLYHPSASSKPPHHPPNGASWYAQPDS